MVYYHYLTEKRLDVSDCIEHHSGDKTVAYKIVNGQPIYLSLYYPEEYCSELKYPVFVFVHGGGWAGHKVFPTQSTWAGDHLGFLARYYANKGFVSISIDYRLMQENGQKEGYQLIDLYEDCVDAISYLKKNEKNYGLDFGRAVLLGESAGGYLAAALATFSFKEQSVFQKVILVNAITDLFDSQWNQRVPKVSTHPMLQGKSKLEMTLLLSPVHQISETVPKTLLVHGTDDTVVRLRHSQSFYDEMCLHKNEVELHLISDTEHAFLLAEYMNEKNRSLSAAAHAIEIIDKWL